MEFSPRLLLILSLTLVILFSFQMNLALSVLAENEQCFNCGKLTQKEENALGRKFGVGRNPRKSDEVFEEKEWFTELKAPRRSPPPPQSNNHIHMNSPPSTPPLHSAPPPPPPN